MRSKVNLAFMLLFGLLLTMNTAVYAHCDSYDGPTLKDAVKALETNNVNLVLKWVEEKHETEIKDLFAKTYALKSGDQEIYKIVEKHFFETLVRLHREGEGAPFTGLKSEGSATPFVRMIDKALEENTIDDLLGKLNSHINVVIKEKFEKAYKLKQQKEESTEKGRDFVEAYVDYVHSMEAIHGILEHGAAHHHEE